ncbi:nucleotide cyclase [Dunaliella salina]|uniref:Nucleotide cyclase n=1 Tax=Dunaliella salina TaxID=3046 RepID=A0ABQ7FXV5_DUNSA|nr:nucleotide cyclase [Dunaliella salina]|eukprot:KAF5827189.1 nucleotide cyclase [Dunaliella salina]
MYEACTCSSGSQLKNLTRPGRTFYFECVPLPDADEPFASKHPWAVVVIIVVGLIAVTLLFLGLLGRSKMEWELRRWKKRMLGAPASGQPASIVTTDVAGYTALCAKDPRLARTAMDVHNKIIESARWANCGSVIDMGGDSYTLAFRDAFDAVAFSLQTQLLMESAVWPNAARVSRSGSIVPLLGTVTPTVSPTPTESGSPHAGHGQPETPRISGNQGSVEGMDNDVAATPQLSSTDLGTQLRVRIGIATGTLAAGVPLQTSPVVTLSKEISDAAAGGQTFMDGATFQLIKDQLLELGSVTEDGLGLDEGWTKQALKSLSATVRSFRGRGPAYSSGKEAAVVLNMGHFVRSSAMAEKDVAGMVETDDRPSTCSQHMAAVPVYTQSNDASTTEGQLPEAAGKEKPRSLLIFQVVPARMLPHAARWGGALSLSQDWVPSISSQAFFNAPGALQSFLGNPELLPCITAVFACVSGFLSFEEKYPEEAAQVADQVVLCVQRMLQEVEGGYLCRTFQGCKFMLTFSTPEAAIKWCLGTQQAIMEQPWSG